MKNALNITVITAIIILIWIALSKTHWANISPTNMWFAKPNEVLLAIKDIFSNEFSEIALTFQRVFLSSFISVLLGILSGICIGYYTSVYNVLKPFIDFWRSIPPILVIPILFYWDTSYDKEYMRLMLVVFGCFPILTMLVADAVADASKERLVVFKSISPSFIFKLRNVIAFEIMSNFYTGIRAIISFAIVIIIVSEMIISPQFGIGKKILHYQSAYEIQYVYAYSIILGFIGLLLNLSILELKKRTIKWKT
jgi:NitT/TauT family transport system permease protein